MTLRIVEIHRVLKPTGSFYLHCDPTASHYLKLVLDGIFCTTGGDYKNEIVWCYNKWNTKQSQFPRNHDIIFFYTKDKKTNLFNSLYVPPSPGAVKRWKGKRQHTYFVDGQEKKVATDEDTQIVMPDWWQMPIINPNAKERLGYPTQKPEALLERIIKASSNEGDVILDAYCGCGTTIAVAEKFNRQWIGIDITYQSIALILKRLEEGQRKGITAYITLDGVPQDMLSAEALAVKKDDRVRKEFEKWAVLTYTLNYGKINDKKGADAGIDGIAYFMADREETAMMVFQVKSGGVQRGDIAKLNSDMQREKAVMATLITLKDPTAPMIKEAKAIGQYRNQWMPQAQDRIQIVTIKEMLEHGRRLNLPLSVDVLKKAERVGKQGAMESELEF
jgi:site-specific DNA-methyltransferase (adenine-specific)